MARVDAKSALFTIALLVALVPPVEAIAAPSGPRVITCVADRDDDDADGKADAIEDPLPLAARADVVPLGRAFAGEVHVMSGGEHARLIDGGRAVAWGERVGPNAAVQGISAGVLEGVVVTPAGEAPFEIVVTSYGLRDGSMKALDLARDHASLERTPPERVEGGADSRYDDPDALRARVEIPADAHLQLPAEIEVDSFSAAGTRIDVLPRVALVPVPCDAGDVPMKCAASAPLRFVVDDVDRVHPLAQGRSLRAEVGGAIVLRDGERKIQAIRLEGPRASKIGPIDRLRATLRPFVMRMVAGGAPAIGGNDAGAIAALRTEIASASAIWGQCGISFGPAANVDVHVMNPPPPYLLSIGDDAGLPASGGEIHVRIEGRPVTSVVARGAAPDHVANDFARAVERAGFVAVISPNARIAPAASGSVDVEVRKHDGSFATIDLVPNTPITRDATLTVRIGAVDLSDGLQHFTDMDSVAGTLEERTLLKSIDDGDPQTIEIVVVPFFGGSANGSRIGESFIASDSSSVRNVVILDRAGVRARRSSLTLAHELGHVLLDMPGHPDDYGIDTPTLLMDSDAADASPFGPRRLTLDECVRAIRESGPHARLPLLKAWPLTPIDYATAR